MACPLLQRSQQFWERHAMSDERGPKFAVGDRVLRGLHDAVLVVKSVQHYGSMVLYECVCEGDPDARQELCSQRFLRPACSPRSGVGADANTEPRRDGHTAVASPCDLATTRT